MKRTITLLQFLLFSSFLVAQGDIEISFQFTTDNTIDGLGRVFSFEQGWNDNYYIVQLTDDIVGYLPAQRIDNLVETILPINSDFSCDFYESSVDFENQVLWEAYFCELVSRNSTGQVAAYEYSPYGPGNGTIRPYIKQILIDDFFQPWLVIPELGVQRLDNAGDWDEFYFDDFGDFFSNVLELTNGTNQSVWAISQDSIKRYQEEAWENIELPNEFEGEQIIDIDFQDEITYVFFSHGRFLKWENESWEVVTFSQPIENIDTALVDSDGVVWMLNQTDVLTDNYQITAYYEGNIAFASASPLQTENEGLFFYQDNDGQLWFLDYGESPLGNSDITNFYFLDFDFSTNSIQLQSATPQLKVSPNPSKGELQLQLTTEQTQQQARLLVRNLMGQTIYQQALDLPSGKRDVILHLEHVPNGWYTITISSANQEQTQKILIQK